MPSCFVFAYGSNLDEDRMRRRIPSARFVARASLPGHRLCFHKRGSNDGTGKANALATGHASDVVHGVVYQMDAAELADLDRHEGGYRRVRRPFEAVAEGRAHELVAWIYLAEEAFIDDALLPHPRYLDYVIRGARAHGLPATLLAELERTPTLE